MKRTPPSLAVWCLARLVRGERGEALIGDLLERFAAGETRIWFWRQTLSASAFAFAHAAREHGASLLRALAAVAAVIGAMWMVDPWLARKLIHFQTHGLFELDPHWVGRYGWRIAFLVLAFLQKAAWFAFAIWLAVKIHRAQPRLIIVVCAVAAFALHVPLLVWQGSNVLTHSRYLDVFEWTLIHALMATNVVIWCGLWSAMPSRAVIE